MAFHSGLGEGLVQTIRYLDYPTNGWSVPRTDKQYRANREIRKSL
jgi:hypothetical protein